MNGMNRVFMSDPAWFLSRVCVDNREMQLGHTGAATLTRLNANKVGQFDFVVDRQDKVFLADASPGTGHRVVNDIPIPAYWCPFLAGGGTPGWVDVPKRAPAHAFIFTAAMQGCAFVLTSTTSASQFRVYHNQHPESQATWHNIGLVISSLKYSDYGNPSGADGGMTNAFNLLYYKANKWYYLSQTNKFVPSPVVANSRNYRPTILIERDQSKPIVERAAGV